METTPKLVTVGCSNHHEVLIKALWNFVTTRHRVDLSFSGAGQTVSAHHVVVDAFLPPGKLVRSRLGEEHLRKTDGGGNSNLDALLQFMYKGTVTLPEDRLEHLMEVAVKLEFKMLVDAIENSSEELDADTQLRIKQKKKTRSTRKKRKIGTEGAPSDSGDEWRRSGSDDSGSEDGGRRPLPTRSGDKTLPRTFKCKVCETVLPTRDRYMYHLFSRHQVNAKGQPIAKRQCDQCKFTCKTASQMRYHALAKHSGQKPYRCPYENCTFATGRKVSVGVHVRIVHLKIRPHLCEECGFAAANPCILRVHMRRHTGEKPFQCQLCDSAYSEKNALRRHERVHGIGQVKSMVCHVCGNVFHRRDNLRTHLMKTHHIVNDIEAYMM